ncbi:2-polyprenyl-6-methoxyphenol hydroxylase-like FAD-dependent oxidoreductase [Prauserella shujinwangii]|uniref:2-polyprenyl-6-methoxyphenol hydroxylase-like FAD-dependent oxidoreductase n=1 Tax=Prauserella shujinwangii TaxID=1453103 RepID=A0A2T0M3T3_9PSEU|nr:FAD-dependent oxidoreductase [Prauserella shujinwangii]PRX51369.1 2-polyprenyl-6-methoxyphenol hydroxylase-like FAD-dependent oxidoreductase [Prauserella shujinwangii]
MTEPRQHDVAIVGGGPVGLMLACELALARLDVVVLERQEDFDTRLRAPGITARTIEALDRRDLLDELIHALSGVVDSRMMTGRGPDGEAPEILPIKPGVLERVLHDRAVRDGAEVRRRHEVTGIRQGSSGVDVIARGPSGQTHVVQAAYVVGCDGGRSVVRKSAHIGFPGGDTGVVGYQAVVTVDDPDALGRQWRRTGNGVVAYALAPSRVVTIEFDAAPVDRAAPVTLAEVQASLRRTSGLDVTLSEPESLTRFTDNCRLADHYRLGRVLLAGDAAHVHPPFGGQGLNLGLQDAVNLGWKLALAVKGRAPDSLLDTYHGERRSVAARALHNSRAAVAILDPAERNTPVFDLFFGELMRLPEVKRRLHAMYSMIDLRYPTDCGHPLAGRAAPDLRLATPAGEVRVNRLFGDGRGVLIDLADDPEVRHAASGWSDRLRIVTAPTPEGDGFDGLAAMLVRPDGYVAWASAVGEPREGFARMAARWFGSPVTPG